MSEIAGPLLAMRGREMGARLEKAIQLVRHGTVTLYVQGRAGAAFPTCIVWGMHI